MAGKSLNRVILVGNLTRDPELKYTPNGTAVATFGIATNRSWTTSSGQQKEEVQYHRIVAWEKLAELCAKILTKGKKVYIEGRLSYRNFTSKDGQKKSIAEIVLDDFIVFNDGKKLTQNQTEKPNNENQTTQSTQTNEKVETKTDEKTESLSEEKNEPINETESVEENIVQQQNEEEVINPDDIPF